MIEQKKVEERRNEASSSKESTSVSLAGSENPDSLKTEFPLEDKEFRHLVRVMNTDLKGEKQILYALSKIKGVGVMIANSVCRKAKVSITKKTGYLSGAEVKALEAVLSDPLKAGIKSWMLNRRNDYQSGEDKHIMSGNLEFTRDTDIKRMKKTKSYKGLRHQWGLPVRGQKTKSNFRRNKGKGSLGVQKKKVKAGRT